jgi:hypothetical protein
MKTRRRLTVIWLLAMLVGLLGLQKPETPAASAASNDKTSNNKVPMAVDGTYREVAAPAQADTSTSTLAATSTANFSVMGQVGVNYWGELGLAGAPTNEIIQNTKDLGTKMVRVYLPWSLVQPTLAMAQASPPQFDWTYTDGVMNKLRDSQITGLNVLALVTGPPSWAIATDAPHYTNKSNDGPYNSLGAQYAGRFYSELVNRYATTAYRAYAWQLLNEPNQVWRGINPHNTSHTYVEHYAAELVTFYNVLRVECSTCLIISGAVALNNWSPKEWLTEFMSWGSASRLDALSVHYYSEPQYGNLGSTQYSGSMSQAIAKVRGDLGTNSSLPIVITEAGHDTNYTAGGTFPASDEMQSRYNIYDLTQALSQGVKHFSIFTYRDSYYSGPGDPDTFASTSYTSAHASAGLIRDDGVNPRGRKPAFTAVSNFNYEIGDQPYLGLGTDVMALPADIKSYRFYSARIAGGQAWVVWRTQDINQEVGFYDPTGVKLRAAVGLYGQSLTVRRAGGYSYVVVGRSPVYIKWNP